MLALDLYENPGKIEGIMPIIDIVQSTKDHVKLLSSCVREADKNEILALGFSPFRALIKSYRGSLLPQTAFIDGKIAAMWGCVGRHFQKSECPG